MKQIIATAFGVNKRNRKSSHPNCFKKYDSSKNQSHVHYENSVKQASINQYRAWYDCISPFPDHIITERNRKVVEITVVSIIMKIKH